MKKINYFKDKNKEDFWVASLVYDLINNIKLKNILEIGPGRGIIYKSIEMMNSKVNVTIVEPQSKYYSNYSKKILLIKKGIEQCSKFDFKNKKFDLVIISHVFGHIDRESRCKVIKLIKNNMTSDGILIIVDNSYKDKLEQLMSKLYLSQGSKYNIKDHEFKNIFIRNNMSFVNYKKMSFLDFGKDNDSFVKSLNVLFPKKFSEDEILIVKKHIKDFNVGSQYILPLLQNVYIVNKNK